LSSDFIVGFCGENDNDFEDTLDIVRKVQFDFGFMFAYSMREKTHAHRKLIDDVPEETKQSRL
jgi:tRNA A37 methylthiotransferase MiaB